MPLLVLSPATINAPHVGDNTNMGETATPKWLSL
jgi:hypothetical protein